jgi:mannose-6-phosphate isomerase-like protein (cupin superfamily)
MLYNKFRFEMFTKISISIVVFAGFLMSCKQKDDINDPLSRQGAGSNMKGFVTNIEKDTLDNNFFRKVLYTAKHLQLVLMSLDAHEEIGEETHHLDQFIRVETGEGKAVLNSKEYKIGDGSAIVIPAGVKHNIINTSNERLKLYSIYAPPEHKDGVIHKTKADALEHEEFDGKTTE